MEAPGSGAEESSGTPNMRALLVILAFTNLENAECRRQCFKTSQIIRQTMHALTQQQQLFQLDRATAQFVNFANDRLTCAVLCGLLRPLLLPIQLPDLHSLDMCLNTFFFV
jgi:hypothetical protein